MGVAGAIAVLDGLRGRGGRAHRATRDSACARGDQGLGPGDHGRRGLLSGDGAPSGLWNQDIGSTEYLVKGVTVMLEGFADIGSQPASRSHP